MDLLTKYISRTARCSNLYYCDIFKQYGLTGRQHIYIINICKTPGISQEKLTKTIYVNKSNVARQLALLEQNGFITRTQCKIDRRQIKVHPTEKSLDIFPRILDDLNQWNSKLLEDFSEEDQKLLISMMEKVMDKSITLLDESLYNIGEKNE